MPLKPDELPDGAGAPCGAGPGTVKGAAATVGPSRPSTSCAGFIKRSSGASVPGAGELRAVTPSGFSFWITDVWATAIETVKTMQSDKTIRWGNFMEDTPFWFTAFASRLVGLIFSRLSSTGLWSKALYLS